jgi:hypothetical protein
LLRRPAAGLLQAIPAVGSRSDGAEPVQFWSKTSTYRSTLVFLQKSPPVFQKSTRRPLLFKSIYVLVLFLAENTLVFSKLEPVIHALAFNELALMFLYKIMFKPLVSSCLVLFSSFLANKSL